GARARIVLDEAEHRAIGQDAEQLAPVGRRADRRFAAVTDVEADHLPAAKSVDAGTIRRRHRPGEVGSAADAPPLAGAKVDTPDGALPGPAGQAADPPEDDAAP